MLGCKPKILRIQEGISRTWTTWLESGRFGRYLFGLDMPFVLRPVDEGQHQIIEETYFHGIMDSEFMS